ncbi:hypothetical protein ABPG75_009357 [Micractinium tetrahymenae]
MSKLGRLGALLAALDAGPLQPAGGGDNGPPRSAAAPRLARAAIAVLTAGLRLLPAVHDTLSAENAQQLAAASRLLLGAGRRLLASEAWQTWAAGRQSASGEHGGTSAAASAKKQDALLSLAGDQVYAAESLVGAALGGDRGPDVEDIFPPADTAAWLEAVLLMFGLREELPSRPGLQGQLARLLLHATLGHAAALAPPRVRLPHWQLSDSRQRASWVLMGTAAEALIRAPLIHAMDSVLQQDLGLLGRVCQAAEALAAALPATCPSPAAARAHQRDWEAVGMLAYAATLPLLTWQPGSASTEQAAVQQAAGWSTARMLPALLQVLRSMGEQEGGAGAEAEAEAETVAEAGYEAEDEGGLPPRRTAATMSQLWEGLLTPLGSILPAADGAPSPQIGANLPVLLAAGEAAARHLPALLKLYYIWEDRGARPTALKAGGSGQLGGRALPPRCLSVWNLCLQRATQASLPPNQGADPAQLQLDAQAALAAAHRLNDTSCRLLLWAAAAIPHQQRLLPALGTWGLLLGVTTMGLTLVQRLHWAAHQEDDEGRAAPAAAVRRLQAAAAAHWHVARAAAAKLGAVHRIPGPGFRLGWLGELLAIVGHAPAQLINEDLFELLMPAVRAALVEERPERGPAGQRVADAGSFLAHAAGLSPRLAAALATDPLLRDILELPAGLEPGSLPVYEGIMRLPVLFTL